MTTCNTLRTPVRCNPTLPIRTAAGGCNRSSQLTDIRVEGPWTFYTVSTDPSSSIDKPGYLGSDMMLSRGRVLLGRARIFIAPRRFSAPMPARERQLGIFSEKRLYLVLAGLWVCGYGVHHIRMRSGPIAAKVHETDSELLEVMKGGLLSCCGHLYLEFRHCFSSSSFCTSSQDQHKHMHSQLTRMKRSKLSKQCLLFPDRKTAAEYPV